VLDAGLEKFTENTISEREALAEDVEETRRRGFGVAVDDWSIGLAGVAAPILDRTGQAFAAVGISFPTSRVTEERVAQMGKIAKRVARGIEERLKPEVEGTRKG
jgi:DNA-binding IclR family transcriptional regulator